MEDTGEACVLDHPESHSGHALKLLHVQWVIRWYMSMTVRTSGCCLAPRGLEGEVRELSAANTDKLAGSRVERHDGERFFDFVKLGEEE